MSTKDLRLDFEATLAQAITGYGYAHYGYWPDGPPDRLTLQALGAAQHAYFELLAARIPPGTQTVLDVGSGTGANAVGLTAHGYALECLCPSEHLNALARAKLPDSVEVHDCTFEAYESDRRFDLCLFAESFHYIALDAALAQLARYAKHHVLIFDYFRKTQGVRADGTRGTHAEFRQALEAQAVFDVVRDDDMTEAILPTFILMDHLRTDLFGPFATRARRAFARDYPWRARLVEWFFGKRLDRVARPPRKIEQFADAYEYRLILMKRR